jgi:hypothetical protein
MRYDDATKPGARAAARDETEAAEAAAPGEQAPDPARDDDSDDNDDTEAVEHEGQVYRIPKALKGAFLMNADYTRKTQELAGHRRALERDRAELAAKADSLHGALDAHVGLHAADQQLEAFAGVDWQAFAAQDPHGAQDLWMKYQDLAHTRERYGWALTHHQSQQQAQEARELTAQLAHTGQVLSRQIEGWSPQVAAKLVDYAAAFGVTIDELREIADPRLWMILHRAHLGDQALQQQATARNVAQTQAVRPAVSVSGTAAPAGSVRDEMATGEWMKRRNEQTGRRR